ncbi:MAG: CPBP family glutamic-type intramembrane protease [Clostridia bacterium]
MKSKIGSIVKYTVEKNIRNKWFIIMNIVMLFITIIGFNFSNLQEVFKKNNISFNNEKLNITIVDNSNILYQHINKAFLTIEDNVNIERKEIVAYDKDKLGKNSIIIEAVPSDKNLIETKIISKEGIDNKYYSLIENAITEARYDIFTAKYEISKDNVSPLMQKPYIDRVMIGVNNDGNSDTKGVLQTLLNYLVLLILIFALSKIANEISQEKMSKSIEYVLTSINEKSYLIAKVISINLTLIVQFLFTLVYAMIALVINSVFKLYYITPQVQELNLSMFSNIINPQVIIYIAVFIVFVLLTVLILCVIQAALSSKTTSINEAGNATILLMMLNLCLYFLAIAVISPLKAPSIIIYIVSCIPIISMYFVPTMIILGHATIIQVIVATVLLILSIPFVFKISAKIFKNGVLDFSNKKSKLKSFKKVETLEEKQKQEMAKSEYSKYGFVIGIATILFVVVQIGVSLLLSPLSATIYNVVDEKISMINITSIITIITYVLSLIIPILFVNAYIPKVEKVKKKLDIKAAIKYILMILPIVAILQIALSLLLDKLGLNFDIMAKVEMFNTNSLFGVILCMLQVAILPAILEELFIRKAVLNFSKKYGIVFAIITSSVLFAIIHLNISQIIFAFLLGIILAILTLKTGSIIPAGIIHFLNNGYAAFMLIFQNNTIAINVVNIVYLILILFGVFLIFKYAFMKIRKPCKLKNSLQECELDEINKDKQIMKYRYIFSDYSFIIALILTISMLVMVQTIISI